MPSPLYRHLPAFRHRNYRLFFYGQVISVAGTWMQSTAQAWLVFRLTHSPALLGLTAFLGQLPGLLVSPLAGLAADRMDRRRLMILTQAAFLVQALVMAGLTFTGAIQVWHVLVLASVQGLLNGFDMPVRQSFIVEMVGRKDLTNAIGLNASIFNGARAVGPAIAGLLIAATGQGGEGWCFLVNALSYLAVLGGLLMMRLAPSRPQPGTGPAHLHIAEGFRYAAAERPIFAVLRQAFLAALLGMPFATLMPVFAEDILHSGSRGLGTLMSMNGLGALAGAVTLSLRRGPQGLARWIALTCFGFALSLAALSLSTVFWASCLALLGAGYCMIFQMAGCNTLIQSIVPERYRGRVMSIFSMVFLGAMPLGALASGSLAARIGAPRTVQIASAACLLAGALFWRALPGYERGARRLVPAQQPETPEA